MIVASLRPYDLIPPKTGTFEVRLRAANVPTRYRNSEYWVWLEDMKKFYERLVTSRNSATQSYLDVDVKFEALSGSLLAQCGPGDGTWDPYTFINALSTYASGVSRPNFSTMTFNTNYYKEPPVTEDDRAWKRQFFGTALHEMLHGLGLGVLWNGPFKILVVWPLLGNTYLTSIWNYNVVGVGNTANPRYTKTPLATTSYALSDYRSIMVGQAAVDNIPIENSRGAAGPLDSNTAMVNAGGTALAHWRGSYGGTPSGIKNLAGQDRIDEILTSWSSRNEGRDRWFGRYTVGALRDIGYFVSYTPISIAINDWKSV